MEGYPAGRELSVEGIHIPLLDLIVDHFALGTLPTQRVIVYVFVVGVEEDEMVIELLVAQDLPYSVNAVEEHLGVVRRAADIDQEDKTGVRRGLVEIAA